MQKQRLIDYLSKILPWMLGILTSFILFCLTELCNYNQELTNMSWRAMAMNVAILFCILLTVYVITDRWWISIGFSSILVMVLMIVNIYSIEFRTTPISARDLYNAKSAMNVLGSYEITLNKRVIFALVVGLCLIILSFICFWLERRKRHSWKKWGIQMAIGCLAVVGFFRFFCFGICALNVGPLDEEKAYSTHGFMQMSVDIFKKAAYKINKPEGYALERLNDLEEYYQGGTKQYSTQISLETDPDIILIVNESWYDLTQVSNLTTDIEIMPYIKSMENTLCGYVSEPGIGYGTNLSEYEVLTGNSLQIMQGITPFTVLNMEGATSIVSCLKEQGYQTAALHPEVRDTYQRINAYPAIGFEQFYFIDDFEEWEYWENRTDYVTDESSYKNLLKIYNEYMEDESPKFLYNLTTQNHGEWILNSTSLNPVHVQEDFGDEWLGYRLNEYLSCVNLTDEAFYNLTRYFADQERPVLICMVGDHAPSFVRDVANRQLSEEEMLLRLHSTPYVIWANYDLSEVEVPEYISMPYIPSILLSLSGAKMIPFYDYMANELLPEVPVLSVYGSYRDVEGNTYSYGEESPYKGLVDTYFFMEYNTVKDGRDKIDMLFHI